MILNPTYTDDGHFLYMVLETWRLLTGISLSHEVDRRHCSNDWEYISFIFVELGEDASVWLRKVNVESKNSRSRLVLLYRVGNC